MSHMDRNNSKPNQYRISGSNKSSMNYSVDSYRNSGAMNSSFGISGSACFAAQKEAVLQAERERIRLIREEQARNAERQAALERTYADRQRSDIVDRIRKKQAQENAAKRKAVQEHYWKTKSLGSIGLGKRNLDGASTTDSEDDEELRRVLMASMHSPGLRPHHSTSEDDVGSDYSSTASGVEYQDTRKVFRGSNGYNADQYEYDEEEEEYDDEEGEEEDDLNSEEEMEMRKSLIYSMQAASPHHHTPTFIHRLMTDDVYEPDDAVRGDTIVLSQDDDVEELKNKLVSVKIVANDGLQQKSQQQQQQPNQQQQEEEKVSPLRSKSTIQKSDVTYDLTGPSSSTDSSSSSMSFQEQRMAAAASVKPEPSDKGPASGFSQVLIRMPNGTKFPRRFRWSDTIKDLKNFIESKADESGLGYEYEITRDFPKKTFHDLPLHTRLDSAGLTSRTLLQIKEV